MAILTKGEFASIAQANAGYKGITGIVNENKQAQRSQVTTSLFLSHSHTEKAIIEQAISFFRTLGISIYVDWMDETMPEKPNGETALRIKNKIKENDKFVLLGTNAAVASKWCNWELGYADNFKLLTKKLAILPLADNNQSWSGNEYLQIYPRIERSSTNDNSYWVWYPDRSLETLNDWLKRK